MITMELVDGNLVFMAAGEIAKRRYATMAGNQTSGFGPKMDSDKDIMFPRRNKKS